MLWQNAINAMRMLVAGAGAESHIMHKVGRTAVLALAWSQQPPWRLAAALADTGIQACAHELG